MLLCANISAVISLNITLLIPFSVFSKKEYAKKV